MAEVATAPVDAAGPAWSRLLMAGFAASVLILMLTAALSTWNHHQLVSTGRQEVETHSLLASLADLEVNVERAQGAERGFVITGEEAFLVPLAGATNKLHQLLHSLSSRVGDAPDQQERLKRLAPMTERMLALLQDHVQTRRRGFEAAAAQVRTQDAKRQIEAIEEVIAEMVLSEQARLTARQAASAHAQHLAYWFNNAGRLLSIALFAVVFFALLRENSLRRRSELALQRAGAELERRVQERTSELDEKNRELETILYIVSHDLRSPLVNLQGFSRRLSRACHTLQALATSGQESGIPPGQLRPVVEETIPQALGFIESGVKRMDQLLSGFLRYSRLGRVALNIGPLDMNRLVNEVVEAMCYQIEQAAAAVRAEPLPPCLGDATQVNQVFANLLDNALKYRHPSRPLQVIITGRWAAADSVYAVSDNGMGIAPEHQTKIFEIFHRLDPGEVPGEGLGLTIAQRILERQQGRIWLQSQPGEGTTFFVALPRARPANSPGESHEPAHHPDR